MLTSQASAAPSISHAMVERGCCRARTAPARPSPIIPTVRRTAATELLSSSTSVGGISAAVARKAVAASTAQTRAAAASSRSPASADGRRGVTVPLPVLSARAWASLASSI